MDNNKNCTEISWNNLNKGINYFCVLGISIPYLLFFILFSFFPKIFATTITASSCISLGMLIGFSLILLSIFLTGLRCWYS